MAAIETMPGNLESLFRQEKHCLRVLCEYISKHGYSPSYREVARIMGLKAHTNVEVLLCRLQAKGWLTYEDSYRSIRLWFQVND